MTHLNDMINNENQMINVKIVAPDKEGLPDYQTAGASGMDVKAFLEKPIQIPSLGRVAVPTGLRMAIPPGFEMQVRPRSGLAKNHGITVLNSPGTIDSDYRGELLVLLVNLSAQEYVLNPGERIAQLVLAKCERVLWNVAFELEETERGEGGFGSTGI